MNQNQKSEMWYGSRKEPNIQISIMREIGINGKQTKADLARNLQMKYPTIDKTLSRNDKNDDFLKLFWGNGTITKLGVEQTLYSLTQYGVICLLRDHYKESGKPYLNLKEYSKFISMYEKQHSRTDLNDKIPFWIHSHLYFACNPSIENQLISKFKDNKKLQKINSSIKTIESKTEKLKNKKTEKTLERYHFLNGLIKSLNQ